MDDMKEMLDAVKHLNQVWAALSDNVESKDYTSEIYNAMCEIDEAVIYLVEKVGLCIKAEAICSMYGCSSLSATHSSLIKRNSM